MPVTRSSKRKADAEAATTANGGTEATGAADAAAEPEPAKKRASTRASATAPTAASASASTSASASASAPKPKVAATRQGRRTEMESDTDTEMDTGTDTRQSKPTTFKTTRTTSKTTRTAPKAAKTASKADVKTTAKADPATTSKTKNSSQPKVAADTAATTPADAKDKADMDVSAQPTVPRHLSPLPFPSRSSFDPASFPHLFDIILQDQPAAELIALRATCRALRYRVDKQLARHLVLKFKTKEKDSIHVVPRVFEMDYRFSALPGSWGELAHWRPFFADTRILDICGRISPFISLADRTAFKDLDVLRIRGQPHPDTCDWFTAKTLVVTDGPAFQYNRPATDYPIGTTKIVFSLSYRPSEGTPGLRRWLDNGLPDSVEEVVFLIEKRTEKKTYKPRGVWAAFHFVENFRFEPADVLSAVGFIGSLDRPTKVTFVDVAQNMYLYGDLPRDFSDAEIDLEPQPQAEVDPTTASGAGPSSNTDPSRNILALTAAQRVTRRERKYMDEYIRTNDMTPYGFPDSPDIPDFELMTRDEYRATVGEDVWAYEKGV